MSKSKILKEVNTNFFELPNHSLKNKLYSMKYHMNIMKIPATDGELFVCNKTSNFDKYFVNSALEGTFVYLKDEIISQLYSNTLSLKDEQDILSEVKKLKNLSISIVVFPEKHLPIFGDFEKLPSSVAEFLLKFEMTIKFINLIGTYFINPVWTNTTRSCDTKIEHRFTFSLSDQQSQQHIDNIDKINKFLPSSASIYAKKFPIYLRSNRCAENIEKLIYLCPTCKNFFTLYSEFNCVKCSNCGTAFEISNTNYEISLTNAFSNLDEARNFQYNELQSMNFDDDQIIASYENITFDSSKKTEKDTVSKVTLNIFKDKLSYQLNNKKIQIPFDMIFEFYYEPNNKLCASLFDYDTQSEMTLSFQGNSRENLYILVDLLKIFQEKK